jgi:hypothetical protein
MQGDAADPNFQRALDLIWRAAHRGIAVCCKGPHLFFRLHAHSATGKGWHELRTAIFANEAQIKAALAYDFIAVEQVAYSCERLFGHAIDDCFELAGYAKGMTGLREYCQAVIGRAEPN